MTTVTAEPVLRVAGLSITYRSGARQVRAVSDISFDIRDGEIVGVVGESGSGKSSTAHALIGMLPVGGRVDAGRITFAGADITRLSGAEWRDIRGRRIGFVPQDPMVSLTPTRKVGSQIGEALRVHGKASRASAPEQAVAILRRVGVPEPEVRALQYPHQLSGGLRQRVLIGIGLACDPRLLIADEPTSALDVTVQRQILDGLEELAKASHTAVLLITHDLAVAADRADRIMVMKDGQIVESGPAAQVLGDPRHPYTQDLVRNDPSLRSTRLTPRAAPPADPGPAQRAPLVVAEGVSKEFTVHSGGQRPHRLLAVDGVDLTVLPRETVGLVGESGSGKTTLARLVLGLEHPSSGRISVGDVDLSRAKRRDLRELRRRVQVVYQNPYSSLDPRFTVEEVIAEPLRAFGAGNRADRTARVKDLLEKVVLPDSLRRRRPGELSGGQRQRVAIARAIAIEPAMVVCDEPVSALDVSVQAQILQLLVDLQASLGVSYLFISHDLAVVRQISDRVLVMSRGRIVESGPAREIFDNPRDPYTRELLDAVPGRRADR